MKKLYRKMLKEGYGIEEVDSWDIEWFFSVMQLDEKELNETKQVAKFEDVF